MCPGDGERRQLGRDELEPERQPPAQQRGVRHRARPAGEPGRHLLTRAQVLAGPAGQPAVHLVEAAACPHGGHGRGEWTAGRAVVVRGRGCDDGQAGLVGQLGQRVVAFVGDRVEGVGELDGDVLAPEPVDQLGQDVPGRVEAERAEPAALQRRAHCSLAAPGEHQPVAVGRLGQLRPMS